MVNRLQVTGSRVYSEAELLTLTGFTPDSELSLGDLRAMALKITERYRSAGYFVAQATCQPKKSRMARSPLP